MGAVRMGPPKEMILKLQNTYSIKKFIETGTYYGKTAYWASRHFDSVTTIEYSEQIYKKVTQKYAHIKNIEFRFGHTTSQLKELLLILEEPAIFWLDAHWSGGETYGKDDECPLVKEINLINQSEIEHFILIDDARLFMAPPPLPHKIDNWPNLSEVLITINSARDRYVVIIDDVIISVPVFAKLVFAQYCQNIATRSWINNNSQLIKKGLKLLLQGMWQTFKVRK